MFSGRPYAYICPVNTVSVMGNGLALYFSLKYQGLLDAYRKACHNNHFEKNVLFHFKVTGSPHVICLKTKNHWKDDSDLNIIKTSLIGLRKYCEENNISSLGMPGIGCGKGGLKWDDVLKLIHETFDSSSVLVFVYPP